MVRIFTAAGLLVLAGAALAQVGTVYRCKDASGHQSLQSHPCAPGQTVEAAQAYRPEPLTRQQEDAIRRRNVAQPVSHQQAGGTAAVITQRANSVCATARAYRDQAYRNNPKMGYAARQSLGDQVRKACK